MTVCGLDLLDSTRAGANELKLFTDEMLTSKREVARTGA
jgi:hypothetical protein